MLQALKLTVKPNGTAKRVGLQSGDILVAYNGKPVGSPESLVTATQATLGQPAGVPMQVVRQGAILDFSAEGGPLGVIAVAVTASNLTELCEQSRAIAPAATAAPAAPMEVVVTDISMPFSSMVTFMVKWAIASIPAFVILVAIFAFIAGMLRGLMH
ncbi:MAG: PDZ domain-containing protein [Rhodocyclaceae bacterium]